MCIRFDFWINSQNGWKKVDARKILYMSLLSTYYEQITRNRMPVQSNNLKQP